VRLSDSLRASLSSHTAVSNHTAVGRALAAAQRPLVYGGGSKGLMGHVSAAVLDGGGSVTGVVPSAMLRAGGEGDKTRRGEEHGAPVIVDEPGREHVQTVCLLFIFYRRRGVDRVG
jgi:predicted Rossmann-fold nucleotide-binding protein